METYIPCAAAPAPSVAENGDHPSGPTNTGALPIEARRSLSSLTPLLQTMPPR